MIQHTLQELIADALGGNMPALDVHIEYPKDPAHGDFSTNVALVEAKKNNTNPHDYAKNVVTYLEAHLPKEIKSVSIAGPGFINFFLSDDYVHETMSSAANDNTFGQNTFLHGKKIIIEHTDPNPFKEFHIGHMLQNIVGESISRLYEYAGAEVFRATYQGDVGMHIAKAVWGIMNTPKEGRIGELSFLGESYAKGAKAYESNDEIKGEIQALNKKIYERSDDEVNELYDWGRSISLRYFDSMYRRLGMTFDHNFFESIAGPLGKEIVLSNIENNIFTESNGAYVFEGEKYGLHTRVFVNSEGLPTYEGKELALPQMKHDVFPYDMSLIITGNEVNEYFKVLLKALSFISPILEDKTTHIGTGMLRLPEGKMSSRTGDVITMKDFLGDVYTHAHERITKEDFTKEEKDITSERVSIAAVKYSILRQGIGRDVIFDKEQALSFEGDSGPYIQYAIVRARRVLEKGKDTLLIPHFENPEGPQVLERMVLRFPDIVLRAQKEHAPHHIVGYATELASLFNTYYANTPILEGGEYTEYRLAVCKAVSNVLEKSLYILGIRVPNKM